MKPADRLLFATPLALLLRLLVLLEAPASAGAVDRCIPQHPDASPLLEHLSPVAADLCLLLQQPRQLLLLVTPSLLVLQLRRRCCPAAIGCAQTASAAQAWH